MFTKIIISTLLIINCCAEFPVEDIDRCVINNLECLCKAANNFVRKFKDGYPKLNIPKLDPYVVLNSTIYQDRYSINTEFNMKSAEIIGLSTQNFERAVGWGSNISMSKYELYGTIPTLEIKGEYNSDGVINALFLPIKGEGDFHFTLKNIKEEIKFEAVSVERNDSNYLKLENVKVMLKPSEVDFKLTNLFDNNKELGDVFIKIMNKHWQRPWDEFAPYLLDIISDVFRDILQPFLDKYSYDDFFLPEQVKDNSA